MGRVLSLSCTLLGFATAAAFTSTTVGNYGKSTHFPAARTYGTELNMVAIPNPLKKLPWNVQKEKEREERRLKQEGAKLYRELGVAEDATFEEIQEATANLLAKYEGDMKKKVKVEITKDKIMQIRLNQRLSGMIRENKDARATVYLQEDADDLKNQSPEWKPPKWTRGLIVKPNDEWRFKMCVFFGGIAGLGIMLPTQAEGMRLFSLFLSIAFMGGRGAPEPDPGNGIMRGNVGKHTFVALGLALVIYIFVGSLANLITRSIPGLMESNLYGGAKNALVAGGMGLATAYLQPYRKK